MKRIKFITQKVDALIFLLYKKIWKDLLYLLYVGVVAGVDQVPKVVWALLIKRAQGQLPLEQVVVINDIRTCFQDH